MEQLQKMAKQLLESKTVNLVVGYTEALAGKVKPIFATSADATAKLIYDDRCKQNLMTYIHKPEVKAFGKAAFVANVPALKTVMQLAAENQITDGQVIALAIDKTGSLSQLNTFAEMQSFIANNEPAMPAHIAEALAKVEAMSREERWNYWLSEMANCVKCYACRSACPMCYCAQCTTDCNQPQWIPVSSMGQANMEYHIMRAMHLAGRCVNCGECARVCPMEIPLGLLTAKLTGFIGQNFGSRAGTKPELDYALSTFKVEDKETFIR